MSSINEKCTSKCSVIELIDDTGRGIYGFFFKKRKLSFSNLKPVLMGKDSKGL